MAFVAMVVVLPVCLPMQATIRCEVSLRSFSWYGKGLKLRIFWANNEGFCFRRLSVGWFGFVVIFV